MYFSSDHQANLSQVNSSRYLHKSFLIWYSLPPNDIYIITSFKCSKSDTQQAAKCVLINLVKGSSVCTGDNHSLIKACRLPSRAHKRTIHLYSCTNGNAISLNEIFNFQFFVRSSFHKCLQLTTFCPETIIKKFEKVDILLFCKFYFLLTKII